MKKALAVVILGMGFGVVTPQGQSANYPPLKEYMMEPQAEISLARSAAPGNISDHATIKVLTADGYKVAAEGNNGFVCIVMRGWSAPTFTPTGDRAQVYDPKMRAPICFDPVASRTVLPYQELRTKLGMEGEDPDTITSRVSAAYATGELPKMESVSFAYMWSAESYLGPGVGAWHPHMMVYAPYYKNSMLGNECGGTAPCVAIDAGTPFAVVVIPVHGNDSIKAKGTATQGQ